MEIKTRNIRLIDIKRLSKLLSVQCGTVYAWVHRREIPHLKLGSRVLFNPREIAFWLSQHRRVQGRPHKRRPATKLGAKRRRRGAGKSDGENHQHEKA